VHGAEDETVPVAEAHEILAAARPGQARLLLVPGDHEGFAEIDGPLAEVVAFLDQAGAAGR
ncbi:MAG: dipeptidyl aminopeptidase, partial [Azonexus sp.]|nr:dipeptidyl aminopeptidase [Azonexus sp.]